MFTYRDALRTYSANLRAGSTDLDLSPAERRVCGVMLNIASNHGRADTAYPPTDETRADVARYLGDALWNVGASAMLAAYSPAAGKAHTVAHERAVEVLRNI